MRDCNEPSSTAAVSTPRMTENDAVILLSDAEQVIGDPAVSEPSQTRVSSRTVPPPDVIATDARWVYPLGLVTPVAVV